jgi:hypothetical protein
MPARIFPGRERARPDLFFCTVEGALPFLMVVNGLVSSRLPLFPAPYNQK